ncbi:MAG: ribonuclease Z [Clostridia bacterium]|nr:ribonuclease Z [Clostridia bacterium]
MRITFIGTSHGVPEAHRKCSCTMIEVGGNIYFVDMGTHAIEGMRDRNLPIEAVKGIFITHMHGDHSNGLIPFIDICNWFFIDTDPLICIPNIEAVDIIKKWQDITLVSPLREFRFKETKEGVIFDDGVLKVTAVATQHCLNSYSYILEAEGKTVLFTGDLRNPGIDFPAPAMERELDLAICEAAHFSALDYLPVFEKCKIRKVCINHNFDLQLPSVLTLCDTLNQKGIPCVRVLDNAIIDV